MATWFYVRDNQQVGPVALEQLQTLARSGELRPEDRVWTEGMPDWVPASTVPDLQTSMPATPAGQVAVAPVGASTLPDQSPIPAPGSERNWMAITALILGILSVPCACSPVCGIVFQLPGIIFGSLGLKSAKRSLAMAGLSLSILGVVLDIPSGIYGAYQATHDPSNPIYKMMHSAR